MEIDIFPLPHHKEGFARNFDKAFLGLIIITFIVIAFKTATCIIGDDRENELICFVLAIPIFIGYYSLLVLTLHCLKSGIYAYFQSHRKDLNSKADREDMDEYIANNQETIREIVKKKNITLRVNSEDIAPQAPDTLNDVLPLIKEQSNAKIESKPQNVSKLDKDIQDAQCRLSQFIRQMQIDRRQMNDVELARKAEKLEAVLKYTRLTFMPYGFTDEELYQIEESVKLLVEYNGITNIAVLNISKKKGLKQADIKNFAWNIAFQYKIESQIIAQFVLNVFYAWFCNTEASSIQGTLHNVKGKYSIEIDENIIENLPQLEEKVLGKKLS